MSSWSHLAGRCKRFKLAVAALVIATGVALPAAAGSATMQIATGATASLSPQLQDLSSGLTLVDLGAGNLPTGNPADVNNVVEVLVRPINAGLADGAASVWVNGQIKSLPTASAPDGGTYSFHAFQMPASGLMVGEAYEDQNDGDTVRLPAYWDSAHSTSYTAVPLSGLANVNSKPVIGGALYGVDSSGEAVGQVWNGNVPDAATPADRAGLYVAAANGLPAGLAQTVTSVFGYGGIDASNETADSSGDANAQIINRSTQAATTLPFGATWPYLLPMSDDGSVAAGNGTYKSTGTKISLQTPTGYTPLANAVNGSDETAGIEEPGSGVSGGSVAAVWDGTGAVTSLASLLPGWSSTQATGIDDDGDVVGLGTAPDGTTHGFLLQAAKRRPPIVNSAGDAPAANPTGGSCDTGKTVKDTSGQTVPECTLRAAIQAVNAIGTNSQQITFEIPSSALGTIQLNAALPRITAPGTVLDGTTEFGNSVGGSHFIQVDGGGLGTAADCVSIGAVSVTVAGLDLTRCPVGVDLQAPGQDKVQGDMIGLALDGQTPAGGSIGVSVEAGSAGNLIGGTTVAQGNVISNVGTGIAVTGSGNEIQGDKLGTSADGSAFVPDQLGVILGTGSTGNSIGAATKTPGTAPGNVIVAGDPTSQFDFGLIVLGSSNTVKGNVIGLDATGARAYSPGKGYAEKVGVLVAGPATAITIGGSGTGANQIAGASLAQVMVDGAGAVKTQVLGNRIGSTTGGDAVETEKAIGIADAAAAGAVIGAHGAGNKITGQQYGVEISQDSLEIDFTVSKTVGGETTTEYYAIPGTDTPAKATAARVQGNLIGPLPDGHSVPETPEEAGVLDKGGEGDLIGGFNTISWNVTGIDLDRSDKTGVEGNLIGTDTSGLDALPNLVGIKVARTEKLIQIGNPGEPDTISGNRLGIADGGDLVEIRAEIIGPTRNGTAKLKPYRKKLPAALESKSVSAGGIDVMASSTLTVIGGDDKADGVTIAGTDGTGVSASARTLMDEDRIGVGTNGRVALENKGYGLEVQSPHDVLIGNSVVAHSGKAGIWVDENSPVVVDTTVYDNDGGGIELRHGAKAPTAPKIISIESSHRTDVKVDANVPNGTQGILQVFSSSSCQKGGGGEKLLDADTIRHGQHDVSFDLEKQPAGTAITATLMATTDPSLSFLRKVDSMDEKGHIDGSTSKFSSCGEVRADKQKQRP